MRVSNYIKIGACLLLAGSIFLSSCSGDWTAGSKVEYSEYELWRAVASCKSFAMVDQALEHGADIDSYSHRRFAENDGTIAVYYSPAWGASNRGDHQMLEYLLQKGADVNYQERADGSTLAMKMAGHWEFEKVLEHNVDFMLEDDLGRRVIDYVVKNSKRSDENSQYQLVKRLEPDALRASTLSWTSKNAVLMVKDIWLSLPESQWKEISPYLLEALRGNVEYLVEHYDKWLKACKDDPQAVRAIYAAFAFCDDEICDLDFASYGSNSQFLKCALTAGNWKNAEKMIQKTAPEEISMSRYLRELIEYGAPVEVMDWMKEKGYEAMINDYVLLAGAQCSKDWCEKLLEECVDERDAHRQ